MFDTAVDSATTGKETRNKSTRTSAQQISVKYLVDCFTKINIQGKKTNVTGKVQKKTISSDL